MKFSELVDYCKSIEVDCTKCEKADCCSYLSSRLENISPIGLMDFIKDDEELFE